MEVLGNGKAYIVELFGDWVKYNEQGDFVPAIQEEADSFMETIGIETAYPHQLILTIPARETMGIREHLTAVLDNLSDDLVAEVRDESRVFAAKTTKASKLRKCSLTLNCESALVRSHWYIKIADLVNLLCDRQIKVILSIVSS